jgi:hypothetical protein
MYRLTCCEKTTGSGGLDNCPETSIIGSMMNAKEFLMKKVDFVAAEDGCIEFVVKSNDAEVLAKAVLEAGGFATTVMASSSCDFAAEYGFENQGCFDALFEMVAYLVEFPLENV